MRLRPLGAVVALIATLLAVAGCGGGGSSETSSASSQGVEADAGKTGGSVEGESGGGGGSKAKFIKEADAICDEANAEIRPAIDRYARKSLTVLGRHASEVVHEVLAPRLEEEIREIRALDAPPSADADLEAVLASVQQLVEEARASPSKVVVEPGALAKSERVGRNHGFKSCGGY